MPDLTILTDEELVAQVSAVLKEQERRRSLAMIPGQIAGLTAQYIADGGDPLDLE